MPAMLGLMYAAGDLSDSGVREAWAMLPAALFALLVVWAVCVLVLRASGWQVKRMWLASATLCAWVYLLGVAYPMYYYGLHSSDCKIDPSATLLSPVVVFSFIFVRCKLAAGCNWKSATVVALLAELALLSGNIALAVGLALAEGWGGV